MSNADVWAAKVARAGVSGGAPGPFDDVRTGHPLIDVETHPPLCGIVWRDTGESCQDFLTKLARLIRRR
jgi:hypothetical protein